MLKDKVILVTGGGMGIGEASARVFAAHGARVVVSDMDGGHADAVARAIVDAGGQAIGMQADVTNEADTEDATIHITKHVKGMSNLLLGKDREGMSAEELAASKAREKQINGLAMKHALRHLRKIVSPFYDPSKRSPPRGVAEILAGGGTTAVPVPGSLSKGTPAQVAVAR